MHGKSFMDIPNTNQSLHVQKVHTYSVRNIFTFKHILLYR